MPKNAKRRKPAGPAIPVLIQHDYVGNPWGILVCATLLSRAPGTRAREPIRKVTERWPSADALVASLGVTYDHDGTFEVRDDDAHQELYDVVAPLGLALRRVNSLCRIALHLTTNGVPQAREKVLLVPGCGDYAADCYEYFVLMPMRLADAGYEFKPGSPALTVHLEPPSKDRPLTEWLEAFREAAS